jgi:hypothetical protein
MMRTRAAPRGAIGAAHVDFLVAQVAPVAPVALVAFVAFVAFVGKGDLPARSRSVPAVVARGLWRLRRVRRLWGFRRFFNRRRLYGS